jgi:flagellar hook assembly protein FlgD
MSRSLLSTKFLSGLVFLLTLFSGLHAQPEQTIGMSKAYPNPFKESITIEYQLQQSGRVEIWINNILGQQIKSLVKEDQQAGLQRVKWDGMDESGSLIRNGIYYITLRTKTEKAVIKVMKTK